MPSGLIVIAADVVPGESTVAPLPMSGKRPLLLSADENEQAQRHRFHTWLDAARNAPLAQWTKFL